MIYLTDIYKKDLALVVDIPYNPTQPNQTKLEF